MKYRTAASFLRGNDLRRSTRVLRAFVVGIFAVVGIVAAFFFFIGWLVYVYAPVESTVTNEYVVEERVSSERLVSSLAAQGYIGGFGAETAAHILFPDTIERGSYRVSRGMTVAQLSRAFRSPDVVFVTLTHDLTRSDAASRVARSMGWSADQQDVFQRTYARMQWEILSDDVVEHLTETAGWREVERNALREHRSEIIGTQRDVLSGVVPTGTFFMDPADNPVSVARYLLSKLDSDESDDRAVPFDREISATSSQRLTQYLRRVTEYRPDIVPLPPRDVSVRRQGDRTLLVFSTTYYNTGRGPLELVADPSTRSIPGDVKRNVLQRIQRPEGDPRSLVVGTFQWHDSHLHYHFSDFVDYILEPVDSEAEGRSSADDRLQKTTFCVRDVSRVHINTDYAQPEAEFRICRKVRQGVSVGWGDTYFSDYPDQNLDVTNLPAGTYRLTFVTNPERRFVESNYENNKASALLRLNPADAAVDVLSSRPTSTPDVDHVYPEQPFGVKPIYNGYEHTEENGS